MKHTPGPWFLGERFKVENDQPYFAYGIGNGASHVGYSYAGMIPHDEAVANARLIAAAPELLEALQALLPMAEAIHEVPNTTVELARAAIAKAGGDK